MDIINKEQHFINIYKPALNLNATAVSSLGFNHSKESKRLIYELRKTKTLSNKTKKRLNVLFPGNLNPFWSKVHSQTFLEIMSKANIDAKNPMFNKEKSQ